MPHGVDLQFFSRQRAQAPARSGQRPPRPKRDKANSGQRLTEEISFVELLMGASRRALAAAHPPHCDLNKSGWLAAVAAMQHAS
jgi:hypothetical protein